MLTASIPITIRISWGQEAVAALLAAAVLLVPTRTRAAKRSSTTHRPRRVHHAVHRPKVLVPYPLSFPQNDALAMCPSPTRHHVPLCQVGVETTLVRVQHHRHAYLTLYRSQKLISMKCNVGNGTQTKKTTRLSRRKNGPKSWYRRNLQMRWPLLLRS